MRDTPCRRRALTGWVAVLLWAVPSSAGVAAEGPSLQGRVTIVDRQGKPSTHHEGVVVFLDQLEHPPSVVPPPARATIRQAGKRFLPEVLPILVGTTVDFPNDDTIYHNVFSLSKIKPFDLGLYEQGGSRSVTFDRPGLVKVYCNIHSQMVGSILVLPNAYFTVTDSTGRFVISNVPLGASTVRTWSAKNTHPPEQRVVVTPTGIQDLSFNMVEAVRFEIREDAFSIPHKNKWGQDYPSKY